MGKDLIEKIKHYEELLVEVLNASQKYLGVISVKLLLERVLWDISQEYKEITLIHYDERGLSIEALAKTLENLPDFPVDEMFKKFFSRYVEILAKLIGKKQAEKIAEQLSKKDQQQF